MDRRAFLGTAASAGAVAVPFVAACGLPPIPKRPAPDLDAAAGWIRHVDGRYELRLPRAEMGQNIATALRRIACDELGVAPQAVRVVLSDTAGIARWRATVGSESIRDYALPLAQACATLRRAVAEGRSGMLKAEPVPLEQLRSLSGASRSTSGTRPRGAPLVHARAIVTGEPLFAGDVRLPGMVYGQVLRAPVAPGIRSRLVGHDDAAARALPGFVATLRDARLRGVDADGLGTVAQTPATLERVAVALAPRWEIGAQPTAADVEALLDVDARLAAGSLRHRIRGDAVDRVGRWDVDLRVELPAAAHAAIEPRCAVADWRDGTMRVWVGSQDPFYVRDVVAGALDIAIDRVIVQPMRIGGAFGGRTICTVELEAALLARAVGRPVKVQWTRAQEFAQAFHRPPSRHRIRASVAGGRIVAWWHAFVSSHVLFTSAVLPPWIQRLTDFVGDNGVARGAQIPYAVPLQRIEYGTARLPYPTGPWRGLGAGPNLLAIESAIDECARAAGVDPVSFRLAHLGDPRLARVLERVAAAAAAGPARNGSRDRDGGSTLRGRGVACGIYKSSSYAAAIADVEIDRASGEVRVTRLQCAHDCGRMIDADQVRAQVEGNLVWCIGMVLVEALPYDDGAIRAASFADAPIPRIGDVPPIDVLLVDDGAPSSGAGETAIVAGAAAIANALRDATGVRFGRYPVRPDDVVAALRTTSERSTLRAVR